jgi:hypothetical protein
MQDIEQTIRERAYHLWLDSGCQDGSADTHWLAAQREVLSASLDKLGHVAPKASATKRKRTQAPRKKKAA